MFLRVFIVLCALCSASLSANPADHLRKVTNKGSGHRIRNVDFIYMINLDKRPEKYEACVKLLAPYGIKPYRFSAINGWEDLSLADINDVGLKYASGMRTDIMGTYYPLDGSGPCHEKISVPGRNYFCHCMSRGAIGCALSHLSILKDALDSGYETIWVMEDDISIVQDPNLVSDLIDDLDKKVGKKWDMLFTDQDTINNATGQYTPCTAYAQRPDFSPEKPSRFAAREDISKQFRRIGALYGLYSVIIRKSGMKKIFDFVMKHKVFLPIDMEFYLPSHMRIYTVKNDVVSTQRYALSDNGSPSYKKS